MRKGFQRALHSRVDFGIRLQKNRRPMHLHFLGTRGEIEVRTRQHRMHSALLVSHRTGRVMIDCGLDWLRKLRRLRPDAIVLTHAHPDHA
jgi:glyoxylase-like metal-dependent hydrolase (beta-lactamase superfamily II)